MSLADELDDIGEFLDTDDSPIASHHPVDGVGLFDADDPATMNRRPELESKWNNQADLATPPKPHQEENTMKDLQKFQYLREEINVPSTNPDTWFPQLSGEDTVRVLRDSAGPIDTGGVDELDKINQEIKQRAQNRTQQSGGSRPAAPGAGSSVLAPFLSVGVGMMGSGGPWGYDASGSMGSPDGHMQVRPETDRCYGLEETWLKQCAAPVQTYLQTESLTVDLTPAERAGGMEKLRGNDQQQQKQQQQREHGEIRRAMWEEAARLELLPKQQQQQQQQQPQPSSFLQTSATILEASNDDSAPPPEIQMQERFLRDNTYNNNDNNDSNNNDNIPSTSQQQEAGMGENRGFSNTRWNQRLGAEALRLGPVPDSDYRAQPSPTQQHYLTKDGYTAPPTGADETPGFMFNRPGSVVGAGSSHPAAPADPNKPFNFQQTISQMLDDMKYASKVQVGGTDEQSAASYAANNMKSMFGGPMGANLPGMPDPTQVGAVSRGPDYYDPNAPDGPDPGDLQTSGPQKCTRMLNSWLYKCALSPL